MKKILLTIAIILMTIPVMGQVSLYEGLTEGMTKKEVKNELKQNKDTYKAINFGNGVEWQVYSHKTLDYDNRGLTGVHMIASKGHGQVATGKDGQLYLEQTAKILKEKGYEVYLENENWKYPHYWTNNSYEYGLMLVNPEKTKVVHLYYTGTSIMATMTIKSYDQIQQEFEQYKEDEADTVDNLSGF